MTVAGKVGQVPKVYHANALAKGQDEDDEAPEEPAAKRANEEVESNAAATKPLKMHHAITHAASRSHSMKDDNLLSRLVKDGQVTVPMPWPRARMRMAKPQSSSKLANAQMSE